MQKARLPLLNRANGPKAKRKTELVHHRHYATRQEATCDIFAYIEGIYNRTRRHSAIGYLSRSEMELKAV
jgi:putative transposase